MKIQKSKLLMNSIFAIVAIVVTLVSSLVIAYATTYTTPKSNFCVSYSSTNTSAKVSATYAMQGDSRASSLFNQNDSFLQFNQNSKSNGVLSSKKELELSINSIYAILTFAFENLSSQEENKSMQISLADNSVYSNVSAHYLFLSQKPTASISEQRQTLLEAPTTLPQNEILPAGKTIYCQILVEISNLYENPFFASVGENCLLWTLTEYKG